MPSDHHFSSAPHRRTKPPPAESSWAFFLDFDGTLVDIAPTPSAIRVDPGLVPILTDAQRVTGGAIMVVTGRPLEEIDGFLAPLRLPAAAQHGAERRFADGRTESLAGDPALVSAAARIRAYCDSRPGTLMEEKGASVTLHYRGAPAVADEASAVMEALADDIGDRYRLLRGKMVLELKPANVDKGRAIAAVMEDPPFAGRRPVMIGDDRTDEDGFRAVNELGGVSIRVGPDLDGSEARFLLETPTAVRVWLSRLGGLSPPDGPAPA